MEKKEFFEKMQEKSREINLKLSVEQLSKFYKYMELLTEWNEKMNLTAIIEPKEIILKHFIDSLTILKEIKDGDKIVDVGTGAGFPGVPLSIMKEKSEITLVDSLNKRLIFLEEVAKELELKNIIIIHSRAEDFGRNNSYREKYDVAVSRAVANLSTLSEYLIPLIKIDGKCVCMKAGNTKEEVKNAQKAINVLGGTIKNIEEFELPQSDIERTIITIVKERNTPNKYPRKAGIPSKEPIK
jgi:16S rRNA (guanine527-N7)-methyltransferase